MTDTSPESAGHVRGSVVGARLAFAASRWGDSARDDIIASFGESDQKRMRSVAIDGDWFDYSIVERIDERLLDLAGGDLEITNDLGFFAADFVFKHIRAQLGTHEPNKLIEKLGRACQQLQDFAHCEELQIGNADENRATAFDFTYSIPVAPFYCKTRLAFIKHTIERLGLRVISAEEKVCAGGPQQVHRYEVWWSAVVLVEDSAEPDEKTKQLFRQAVTAERPGHPTRPRAVEAPKRGFRITRSSFLGFLLFAIFAGWAATDGYAWLKRMSAPPPEVAEDDQYRLFTCSGRFDVDVTFDTSSVTIRNKQEVLQAQIILEQAGRSYIKSLDRIQANGSMGIPLSEFRDDAGRMPNRHASPTRIRVLSLAGLHAKETACVPKSRTAAEE